MPYFMMTDLCNLDCNFCFAKKTMNLAKDRKGDRFLNVSEYEYILKFLKRSKIKSLSMVGGEPTLHPQLNQLIALALSEGLKVRVYSNLLISNTAVKHLEDFSDNQIEIIANISSFRTENQNRIENVLSRLRTKVLLSQVIDNRRLSADVALGIIHKFGLKKTIHLKLSLPTYRGFNSYIPIEGYSSRGLDVVKFVKQCNIGGVGVVFGCGFVRCMFSQVDLDCITGNLNEVRFLCQPMIDVGIDLKLSYCFATQGAELERPKLSSFSDEKGIVRYYQKELGNFHSVGSRSNCLACSHFKDESCDGGCLAFTLDSFYTGDSNLSRD